MNSPESLRDFTNTLIRRGLPADYSHRASEELADHYRDLVEEGQGAGLEESVAIALATERLGDPTSLVKQAVRSYQRRHWCGRWRVVTFLFGPVPLLIAIWIVTMLVLSLCNRVFELIGYEAPESSHNLSALGLMILYAVIGWFLLIVPAVLVLALSRLAFRSGVGHGWFVASAVLLAITTGFVRAGFVPSPETVEHPFVVSIPFWMPFRSVGDVALWYLHTPLQVAQLIMPLLTAAIIMRRNAVQRQRASLAV